MSLAPKICSTDEIQNIGWRLVVRLVAEKYEDQRQLYLNVSERLFLQQFPACGIAIS
jgi:hypothetical protein